MGGVVASLLQVRNSFSTVPDEAFAAYHARRAKHDNSFIQVVPGTETAHCSCIYRLAGISPEEHAALVRDGPQRLNLFRSLMRHCDERTTKHVLGYRPVLRVEPVVTQTPCGKEKIISVTHVGETKYITYTELKEKIEAFGSGLLALGVRPTPNQNDHNNNNNNNSASVAIYLDTCPEWMIGIYGIWSRRFVAATVYANLGEEALAFALHETESEAVLCGAVNVHSVVKLMKEKKIHRVPIIYVGELPAGTDTDGVDVFSYAQVEEKGRAYLAKEEPNQHKRELGPLSNDDLALIMYTSGTTGNPKGVMHTHGSLIGGVNTLQERVQDLLGPVRPGEEESYCVYLPMAHIMEFTIANIFIDRGSFLGFGTSRTLTDATTAPCGDLTAYNPILFVGVPRIFDTLRKTIESRLPPVGSLKRTVFDTAYASSLAALREGQTSPYWNEKVFGAARKLLGSRVRVMLSGGGPLSASTQEFVNVVLGPCVIGYGLTETVCAGAIQLSGDTDTLVAGLLEPGQEVKLLDTEDYKHTDSPQPRGEMLSRGPYLFKGYYKQPALTKEAIDEEGWFHTGDVGSITEDGKICIVGRVKALAKNCLGEYIALEVLEALYSTNELLLPNGVCVLVHPDKPYICALVLTDETRATAFARQHGIEGEFPAILEDARLHAAAATSLAQTAKAANRAGFECVKYVRVLADEWTPENDILTAAMKLKRRVIDEKYATTIAELFSAPS